jgi:hypothetical protein
MLGTSEHPTAATLTVHDVAMVSKINCALHAQLVSCNHLIIRTNFRLMQSLSPLRIVLVSSQSDANNYVHEHI